MMANETPASVRYCSPTNSTCFTTCCEAAILPDQRKCPDCGRFVYPFSAAMSDREMSGYDSHKVDMARHNRCMGRR